jgi:3D (Asp-Asp-Asp) domain-containing protein
VTASGKTARHGTVAADPAVFGFGTRLEIPGYGIGVVEDIGGAIKGRHIDIWFPSHAAAMRWGAKRLKVKVLNR